MANAGERRYPSYYQLGYKRWVCRPCEQLLDAGQLHFLERHDSSPGSVRLDGGLRAAACRCIFLGVDGRPLLPKRICFALPNALDVSGGDIVHASAEDVVFNIAEMCRTGLVLLESVNTFRFRIYRHFDVMSIGAFLPLRPCIRIHRLYIRCRRAVYLAQFLQCKDVTHVRLCSRGLRANVSPNAVDYDWCRPLLLKMA